jgi:ribosomal protein S18 acetylase RimI-like enzyme
VSDVHVRAISPDQHDAVMHYFDMVAYADNPNWSKCFRMERLVDDYESRTKQQNREARSELIRSAKANGLVAYRLGRVVGWCHAALNNELIVEGKKDPQIGAIVGFVVAPDQRRQGVATTLLDAALEPDQLRGPALDVREGRLCHRRAARGLRRGAPRPVTRQGAALFGAVFRMAPICDPRDAVPQPFLRLQTRQ